MNIGEMIRKCRKEKNMTQEELACRLGVTAPAVNKWENGNSYPDIMMLAPMARLFGISVDMLLSFEQELGDEEVCALLRELDRRLGFEEFDSVFAWFRSKTELYPNCDKLMVQGAVILDAERVMRHIPQKERFDDYILKSYRRGLESQESWIRDMAADALFRLYLREEKYHEAEECLAYFSAGYPDAERKRASLYRQTGRREEAYQILEGALFRKQRESDGILWELFRMALEEEDLEWAALLTKKRRELTGVFDMGAYYGASVELEFAEARGDQDKMRELMRDMLESVEEIDGFTGSSLYRHMKFRTLDGEFSKRRRDELNESLSKLYRQLYE